jgi:hypothetical protein
VSGENLKLSKITFLTDPLAEKSNKPARKMLDLEVIPERSLGCPEKSYEFILGEYFSLSVSLSLSLCKN